MATQDQRQHIKALMDLMLANKHLVGYNNGPGTRPMKLFEPFYLTEQTVVDTFAAGERIEPDCGEMVTWICRVTGLADPSGFGYNGEGNAETMYSHLKHYARPSQAHLGALAVFGVPTQPLWYQHVAIVYEPGGNPTLFSHGGPNGPFRVTLEDYKIAVPHQRPVTLLDIGSL